MLSQRWKTVKKTLLEIRKKKQEFEKDKTSLEELCKKHNWIKREILNIK